MQLQITQRVLVRRTPSDQIFSCPSFAPASVAGAKVTMLATADREQWTVGAS